MYFLVLRLLGGGGRRPDEKDIELLVRACIPSARFSPTTALFALIVPGPKREDLRRDPRYALHCLTSEPPRHDDAFYLAGTVNEVLDAPTWDRVVEQFLAERGMDSPGPGFEA